MVEIDDRMSLQQYCLVRVVSLNQPLGSYDGWQLNQRAPRIGDVGTIVEVLAAPDLRCAYVVENADQRGVTVWLGEFSADELEVVVRTES